MDFYSLLQRSFSVTDDELQEWIARLEKQEVAVRSQPITDESALGEYREIRKKLVILKMELIARLTGNR